MPRKLIFTDKMRELLVAAFELGMPVTRACDYAGVSTTTFYDYVQRGAMQEEPFASLVKELRKAKADGNHKLLTIAHVQAIEEPAQVRFLLATSDPEHFGKDARSQDFVQEALASASKEEQVQLMATHPEVRAAVLASTTAEEKKQLTKAKRKTLGKGE